MNRYFLVACFSIVLFTSCHNIFGERVRGNGVIKKESRTVGDFNGVDVSGAIDVYIKQGTDKTLTIETDENLLAFIETRNEGGKLVIAPRRHTNLDATGSVKVYVSAPVFEMLHVSGASKIISEGRISSEKAVDIHLSGASEGRIDIKAPKITSDLSGASNLVLSGETKDFSIEASGASHVKGFELLSENANVDLSGASGAEVFASVNLDGDASGASEISYKGGGNVKANTSGAGSIKKVD